MTNKKVHVGDRVIFEGQPKTSGVIVEIHENNISKKDVKVHWASAPIETGLNRNGRGSYNLNQLVIKKI